MVLGLPNFFGSQRQTPRPTENAQPTSSNIPAQPPRKTIGGKGVIGDSKDKYGTGGKGLGQQGMKRHRYVASGIWHMA